MSVTNTQEIDRLCQNVIDAPDIFNKAIAITALINLLSKIHEYANKFADKHKQQEN